jgi:hypothetical protein
MQDNRVRSAETNPNDPADERESHHWDWKEERREWRRERRSGNHLHGLFCGLVLILVGILFLAGQQEWIGWDRWWQYLLIGLGAIFIVDGTAHYFSSADHHRVGKFVPGIILLLVGVAFVWGFGTWWPLVLIGVGAVMLIGFFLRGSYHNHTISD